MSTCISEHGEYGSHTLDADYVCTRCSVLDEDALIAELRALRARIAEPTTVSTATWTYPDGTTVPVPVVHRSPTADASVVRIIVENRTATFTPNGPPFYSVEERAAMESRIAELERQRDEVLALCDEAYRIPIYDGYGEAFPGVNAAEVRAIYGGGE